MKQQIRFISFFVAGLLIISACTPAPAPVVVQTSVPPTQTEVLPTPTATLGPEKNVSYHKPVRVSASWVGEPPEKAVNGNVNDWWGAGGPPPAWIEVDLEGIYSVSKIQVINEGPTGMATYHVLGRSPGNAYQLLHVFEGMKSNNQALEYSPETPWEDISTIRVEILNGIGWAGFREVRVYSREEAKPLPEIAEIQEPAFLAQVDPGKLQPITPDNAFLMHQLAIFGRGPVNELAWSPDGKILAVASPLGIWLYDPNALDASPRLLEGHTRDILSVKFSLDGSTLYSGSQDGTVKEWDTVTGELTRTHALWNNFNHEVGTADRSVEVWSIAFSPDGSTLASGQLDGTLLLWNLKNNRSRTMPKEHGRQITDLVFNLDGTLLASGGADGSIILWDVQSGTRLASLNGQGSVQSLSFSPDGKTLAIAAGEKAVKLWDLETNTEKLEISDLTMTLSLAYSPDGSSMIASGLNGALQIWDVKSQSIRIFREHAGWIMKMAYSPDGSSLATFTWNGILRVWDTATAGFNVSLATHTSPITSISFSPDSSLIATGAEDGGVRLWEVEKNDLLNTLWGHNGRVFGVAFSPDGKSVASAGLDRKVILWDVSSGNQLKTLLGHENFVRCVAFSPDGKLVATGSTDKTVRLWDVASGVEHAVLTGHEGEVESVAFSADGKWLVSAGVDKSVKVWDVASGKEIGILQGNLGFVLGAAISPDGTQIATAGADHSVRSWRLGEVLGLVVGKDQFASIGHPGWVLSITFSPDGNIIASANLSTTSFHITPGEIHLYSAETGFPYMLLRGHTKRVTSIAFSQDGYLLASGSADGSVRLWGVTEKISGSTTSLAAQATAPPASPLPIAEDPFIGEWTAYDTYDGSSMTMSITREGDRYYLTQVDDGASICGKDSAGKPQFGVTIQFTGKAEGDTLNAAFISATCMNTPPTNVSLNLSNVFKYEVATDTLLDTLANYTWKRR